MYSFLKNSLTLPVVLFLFLFGFVAACSDDSGSSIDPNGDDDTEELRTASYSYAFNEGQLLGDPDTAYDATEEGDHPRNLSATLMFEELENGNTLVTVSFENTIDGAVYPAHAHDAADPADTPNNTPYDESPNGDVFAEMIEGNGGTAELYFESSLSFDEINEEYEGFLVVHDPTQDLSTVDLTTYLVLGIFGDDLEAGDPNLRTAEFMYDFNEGQLLDDEGTAYDGEHPRDLMASIMLEEQMDGTTRITVSLMNTLDGETYPVHTHDAAAPEETPNNTPYDETPNDDVIATMIDGNGGTATMELDTEYTFGKLTRDYDGFFVVHDPTQDLSTTDLTTYLILGVTFR